MIRKCLDGREGKKSIGEENPGNVGSATGRGGVVTTRGDDWGQRTYKHGYPHSLDSAWSESGRAKGTNEKGARASTHLVLRAWKRPKKEVESVHAGKNSR